jgi:hypothetical protein
VGSACSISSKVTSRRYPSVGPLAPESRPIRETLARTYLAPGDGVATSGWAIQEGTMRALRLLAVLAGTSSRS